MKLHSRHILIGILITAFVVRMAAVLALSGEEGLQGDMQYHLYAESIVAGNGYVIEIDADPEPGDTEQPNLFGLERMWSFKPPLYPLCLAAIYALGGQGLAIGIFQALCGVAICALVMRVGRRIFDTPTGLLAAALVAVYPYYVMMTARISDTTLFTLCTIGAVAAVLHAGERRTLRAAALAGLLTGAAVMCRPTLMAFIPFAALWLWWLAGIRRGDALLRPIVYGLAIGCALLPWVIRNFQVHDQFVLMGTNGGYTFWQSYNTHTDRYLQQRIDFDTMLAESDFAWMSDELQALTEAQQDKWFYEQGNAYIRDNPGQLPALTAKKLASLWSWNLYPAAESRLKNLVYTLSYLPVLILAIAGIALSRKKLRKVSLLLLLMLAFTLLYALFYGKTIYRMPMDTALCLLAAWAIRRAMDRLGLVLPFEIEGHQDA